MDHAKLDVLGFGNAIVDVLVRVADSFLVQRDLPKGGMSLIDAERALALHGDLNEPTEVSGGSAANAMAGIATLGGSAGFVGKVKADHLGTVFARDIRAAGVAFDTPPAADGPPTARSFVLVTPDAQRTMCTFLGASVNLDEADVDEATVAGAKVIYLEGYLWDAPNARKAFAKAVAAARRSGRRVAFTLSDPFCVDRYRADFQRFVKQDVDILFANEAEVTSLYAASSFDEALQAVRGQCEIAALTRSARGSVIVGRSDVHVIDAHTLGPLVDTTGAGDLYAGGFLYGLTQGHGLGVCGRLAALAAGEVITHLGARPVADLKAYAAELLR